MKELTKKQLTGLRPSLGSFLVLFEYFQRTADIDIARKMILEYAEGMPLFIMQDIFWMLAIFYPDEDMNEMTVLLFETLKNTK